MEPSRYLLRGFALDSSAFDRQAFALDCFIQPLTAPASGLRLPFVFRLRDPRNNQGWWDLANRDESDVFAGVIQAIKEQCMPMLERFKEPWSLEKWPDAWNGIHMAEGVAYGLVLSGDTPEARKWLSRVQELGKQDGRDWAIEQASRAAVVLDALDRSPEDATTLLKQWADQTTAKIRAEIEKGSARD